MIVLMKPQGMTPLDALNDLRVRRPDLEKQTLSYAGRLDPMAEGLLLVLVGDENKERATFERLPKVYEFDTAFGIETDSYDLLGLAGSIHSVAADTIEESVRSVMQDMAGTFEQEYPPFSAVRIGGKPLYALAREGKLPRVMPSKQVTVDSLIYIGRADMTGRDILEMAQERIARVKGNFRQTEIVVQWRKVLSAHMTQHFPVITFRASVTGGTYIRSLAHMMGRKLGCGALASRIVRIGIGEFTAPKEI